MIRVTYPPSRNTVPLCELKAGQPFIHVCDQNSKAPGLWIRAGDTGLPEGYWAAPYVAFCPMTGAIMGFPSGALVIPVTLKG